MPPKFGQLSKIEHFYRQIMFKLYNSIVRGNISINDCVYLFTVTLESFELFP